MTELPFTRFVDHVEKAARNGTKAHVPAEIARAIVSHPAWREFMAERQREMIEKWQKDEPPLQSTASNSGRSGSTGAPSVSSGSSPGTTTAGMEEAVERAERRQALAFFAGMENPRKKRRTP